MIECEHIWRLIDDDHEGDSDAGSQFLRKIPDYVECIRCAERKSVEELTEEEE